MSGTETASVLGSRPRVAVNPRSIYISRLESDIQLAIDESDGNGLVCAVLTLDLGRFKAVTDILGEMSGTTLLEEATRRLHATVDNPDQVSSTGGDEFSIVLPNMAGVTEASALADEILDVLRQPYDSSEGPMLVRPSIGIAVYPADATEAPSLLLRANEALYWAKRRGRTHACRFDPALHEDLVGRWLMERDLRAALAAGAFDLDWQPFVAVGSLKLLGYEAFLRWNRTGHGPVPPQRIMAVAEACDLAAAIDAWVLDAACREAAQWAKPLSVAVNVSPAWLKQNDVAERAKRALAESGLAAGRLQFDIDSRAFFDAAEGVAVEIEQIKALGIGLALNDFGNGCSMLGQLKDLPFDKMKLNRSLLVGLDTDPRVGAVIRTALQLGTALGVEVCATGVETQAEYTMLAENGCDEVQGSFIGVAQKDVSTPLIAATNWEDDETDDMATSRGFGLAMVLGAVSWAVVGTAVLLAVKSWSTIGQGTRWLWALAS